METGKLKPCTCGGEGLLIEHRLVKHPKYKCFSVGCSGNCQTGTGDFATPEQAIADWNRRIKDKEGKQNG